MVLSFICKEREPINIDIGSEKKKQTGFTVRDWTEEVQFDRLVPYP